MSLHVHQAAAMGPPLEGKGSLPWKFSRAQIVLHEAWRGVLEWGRIPIDISHVETPVAGEWHIGVSFVRALGIWELLWPGLYKCCILGILYFLSQACEGRLGIETVSAFFVMVRPDGQRSDSPDAPLTCSDFILRSQARCDIMKRWFSELHPGQGVWWSAGSR